MEYGWKLKLNAFVGTDVAQFYTPLMHLVSSNFLQQ